jgi:hypothetical protein
VARRARGEFQRTWARVGLESARGGMAEAWGCFIGTARCTGRSWTGERARACTGERGCANEHEKGVSATVEHVEPLLLPEF